MIKVLIADDHPVVRRGLREILSAPPDMTVAGEAQNACEALELVRTGRWDVVILDIKMPGKSGLEALKQLKSERPGLPVLVLSVYPEEQYAVRVLRAGADGYMNKEAAPEQLVEAVRKVVSGGKYVSASVAETLVCNLTGQTADPPHSKLTDREFEVLCRMGEGKAVGQIAKDLHLSPKTISTYRARVLDKMAMKSTAEMIHYAITHGLVD